MTYMFAPIGTYDTDYNDENYCLTGDNLKCSQCESSLVIDNNKIICDKCNIEYKIIYNKQNNRNEVIEIE